MHSLLLVFLHSEMQRLLNSITEKLKNYPGDILPSFFPCYIRWGKTSRARRRNGEMKEDRSPLAGFCHINFLKLFLLLEGTNGLETLEAECSQGPWS